jgi:hypothetical protein
VCKVDPLCGICFSPAHPLEVPTLTTMCTVQQSATGFVDSVLVLLVEAI